MFNRDIPKEVILKIFNYADYQNQAIFSRVCTLWCHVANQDSSKLSEHKKKYLVYRVGDISIKVSELEDTDIEKIEKIYSHYLFLERDGKKITLTDFSIKQETFNNLTKAIKIGPNEVVELFKKKVGTGKLIGDLLHEELEAQTNQPLLKY